MQLTFSHDDEAFRHAARAWLVAHAPRRRPPAEGPDARRFTQGWLGLLNREGWSGLGWPQEFGGQALAPERMLIWYEEYARARAPSMLDCSFVGLNHAGPTLIACGTPAQKAFHLPRILSGTSIWCQGFSEPGSGSDLASLTTSATIEGDDLVVSGQKIWSSYADIADYQELLIRTERGSQRHKGLSWVICDMRSPGITVRPITNMAGTRHFAEIFYDSVRIPVANVVGPLHDGWRTAMTTLGFERKTAAMGLQLDLSVKVEDLIARAEASAWVGTGRAARAAARGGRCAARDDLSQHPVHAAHRVGRIAGAAVLCRAGAENSPRHDGRAGTGRAARLGRDRGLSRIL